MFWLFNSFYHKKVTEKTCFLFVCSNDGPPRSQMTMPYSYCSTIHSYKKRHGHLTSWCTNSSFRQTKINKTCLNKYVFILVIKTWPRGPGVWLTKECTQALTKSLHKPLKCICTVASFCPLLTTHNCIPIINLFSYCTPPFSRNHCVSKNNKFCFVRKERLLLGKIHFQVIDYDYD